MARRHDDTPPLPTGNPGAIAEWWAKLPADVFYAVRCGLTIQEGGEDRQVQAGHLMGCYWALALACDVWTHDTTRSIEWIAEEACISYRSAKRVLMALEQVGLIRRERIVDGETGRRYEYAYHLVGPWDNETQRPRGASGPQAQAWASPPQAQAGASPSRETQKETHMNGEPTKNEPTSKGKRDVTPVTKQDQLVGESDQARRRRLRDQKSQRSQAKRAGTVIPSASKPQRETVTEKVERLKRSRA